MQSTDLLNIGYAISIYLTLLSTLVSSLELSAIPKHYFGFVYPRIRTLDANTKKWHLLHGLQLILAVVSGLLYSFNQVLLFKITYSLLAGVMLYTYVCRTVSKDGADQVRIMTLLSFSLCFLLEYQTGKLVSLCFVGLQVVLGYCTSGMAKILSPYWRQGNVLHLIFGTYSFGNQRLSDFLRNHPKLERTAAHFAILTMLAVPISFLVPSPWAIMISLSAIFSFHFATAAIMGLNDFLITFPIAYPGIIILHGWLHQYIII